MKMLQLRVVHGKQKFSVEAADDWAVSTLKTQLAAITKAPASRQKLVYKGKVRMHICDEGFDWPVSDMQKRVYSGGPGIQGLNDSGRTAPLE